MAGNSEDWVCLIVLGNGGLSLVIIYIQKFLQSDWWRASQFILNVVQKCEIECRKLKLVQKKVKLK